MRAPLALAAVTSLALMGCKKVEPAPKELDDLLHFFLVEAESASDETMAEAFVNLDKAVDGGDLEEHWDGSVSDLTDDEVADFAPAGVTAANAAGIFLVNKIDCGMARMAELVTAKNQIELYGTYDDFSREWVSDVEAFRTKDEPTGTWEDDFTVTVLGITYDALTNGDGRWIPDLGDEESPFGATLVTRRIMPEPAVFENDRDVYNQDYRTEVYYARDGGVVHVAAMWREASFAGFDSDNEGIQRTVLNGMKDWDDDSEAACGN